MPNTFLQDYLLYNSGNMSPRRYHLWCGLSILAMTMQRKVYVDHGYFRVYPFMYICLVGRQGIRKSSAKDYAKDLFTECFPTYPIGASVTSREKIVERLSSESCLRSYTDETGTPIEIRPMAFFINELKNFMSINPAGMVEFLTDIYERNFFDSETIKHGLQPIFNPCINILACETPHWIIEKLRLNIIAGGFSRRMLYIYETIRPERITFPFLSPESKAALERCKTHLVRINSMAGAFTWDSTTTRAKFDAWFKGLPTADDEVLEGYYEAKDILAQKVAMMLAIAEPEPRLVLTWPLLEEAIAVLDTIEENLPKLSVAVGRNELALPQQKMLNILREADGALSEKELKRRMESDLNWAETAQLLRHLEETDQVIRKSARMNGAPEAIIVFLPFRYQRIIKSGQAVETRRDAVPPPTESGQQSGPLTSPPVQ